MYVGRSDSSVSCQPISDGRGSCASRPSSLPSGLCCVATSIVRSAANAMMRSFGDPKSLATLAGGGVSFLRLFPLLFLLSLLLPLQCGPIHLADPHSLIS